jgi:hypothetical protein
VSEGASLFIFAEKSKLSKLTSKKQQKTKQNKQK